MAEREEPCVPGTEDNQRDAERRFAALYQAYYRPILAYAVRRIAPGEDAADVVADVFTTAWRRIGELPEAPADRLWLYGVAQRIIAGRRRSARRPGHLTARLRADAGTRQPGQPASGQPGPGQPGPGQPGLRDAISDRLVAALDRLSVREREALQLVLWEELSATFLNAGSTAALRAALYRVIESLSGVQNLGPATDRLGRHGQAVGLVTSGTREVLIFDPATTVVLQREMVAVAPKQSGNNMLPAGTVLQYTEYLRAGVVNSDTAISR